jgi:hypothetical protein
MSVITLLLGKLSDRLDIVSTKETVAFKIMYSVLIVLIIAAGVYYRMDILSKSTGDIVGKYSLYENAMIGGTNKVPEHDLLSIIYSTILEAILFFTGNIVSVPFVFQIVCFTIFMVCGFFTVKKLLGMAASVVFTAYVAFMPVFTYKFTGLMLSTDSLFMAMFGIELLVMALFLQGAYRKVYKSPAFVLWYFLVGAVVGFMAYVDAGTIIMILPFLVAVLFLYGTSPRKEIGRLLFVLFGAVMAFAAMIAQEQGTMMAHATLSKWASFYFHNLNTFSMFWTYTDHKIIYLLTAIGMSGVIIGFWKNRKVENISPWLLSMLFIFATVPFMGATRMNTQVFVTVYYAFILACVADLITTPANESGEDAMEAIEEIEADDRGDSAADGKELSEDEEAVDESRIVRPEVVTPEVAEQEETEQEAEPEEAEPEETQENVDEETAEEETKVTEFAEYYDEEDQDEPSKEIPEEKVDVAEEAPESLVEESSETEEKTAEFTDYYDEEDDAATVAEESKPATEDEIASPAPKKPAPGPRFVPEGMVLPEDDDDADLTPRMKMPEFRAPIGADGKAEKLKVKSFTNDTKETAKPPADDFDIQFKPGDDFDI